VDVNKFRIHSDEQMALDLLKQDKNLSPPARHPLGRAGHIRIVYLPDQYSCRRPPTA
jgi:hypothetical protein